MNEEIIWNQLIASGMTKAGAAGMMGNLYAESLLNPKNLQNSYEKSLGYSDESYTNAVDSGAYTKFASDSAGYGLAQWTYKTRKAALLAYANQQNKSIGDLDMQLDFLISELKTSYASVWKLLCSATSVETASNTVMLQYEAPADISETAKSKRASYSQKFYQQFVNTSVSASVSTETAEGTRASIQTLAQEIYNGTWGSDWKTSILSALETVLQVSFNTYTVVAGDTLTKIAKQYNTTIQAILDANQSTYPDMTANLIRVGWVLKV